MDVLALQRLILYSFTWEGMVILKLLILVSLSLGECDGPVRTDFSQFQLWEDVVVM